MRGAVDYLLLAPAVVDNYSSQCERRAARAIELSCVVCFVDSDIVFFEPIEHARCGREEMKKDIHAERKVRRVQKADVMLLHDLPDTFEPVVPSRRSDDDVLSATSYRFDVRDYLRRNRKLNADIDALKRFFRDPFSSGIVLDCEYLSDPDIA